MHALDGSLELIGSYLSHAYMIAFCTTVVIRGDGSPRNHLVRPKMDPIRGLH